ncbi:hypothetical protein LTR53_008355 [Teratosphaeriaceae sp. CCFEE 6253]|nr:hypothetical protein LTR53_008355 [Teratosphaeriaceae sp. CCFEE 6253]
MSLPATQQQLAASAAPERKPRALADVQLNNILADLGTSSEDEPPDAQDIPAEDARTALGISISRQQTRLNSPLTPAVEKAAALADAGGYFGGFDGTQEPILEEGPAGDEDGEAAVSDGPVTVGRAAAEGTDAAQPNEELTSWRSSPRRSMRLPSPWRAPADTRKAKSLLRDGLPFHRRQTSGPDTMFEGWQKAFMSNLPSMPKNFSFTSPFSSAPNGERTALPATSLKSKRSSLQWPQSSPNPEQNPRKLVRQRSESDSRAIVLERTAEPRSPGTSIIPPPTPYRSDLQRLRPQPSRLRRSTSDTSLVTQRTMSRVSSLGDDSRFEDVRDQVNSRLKAIKDSWQDSSIKLPGLPSLASFAPDFLRERSPSFNGKQSERSSRAVSPEKLVDPMTRQPYKSVKAAAADTGSSKISTHPHFHHALIGLEGDVVVLGGYRGSILRSAEPPNRQVWVPVKVGLNLRKVDLEVGISEKDDERPSSKVVPGGMLTHIGPVDVSKRLFKRLRGCENARRGQLRVHDYGYDWRLNPLFLSKQLVAFLECLPCNQPGVPKDQRGATIIAHSLGGLVTRHAVNKRPELFKGVLYAGVPQTCVNILGPMRNGDEVLLSSRVLTAQVNFTIRTSFALLPLDGRCFIDKHDKDVEYPVDFFDPQTWIEHRLSPCVGRPLPPLSMPEKPSGLSGYVSSVTSALPSLSLSSRKNSLSRSSTVVDVAKAITVGGLATEPGTMGGGSIQSMANGNIDDSASGQESDCDVDSSLRTAVTMPREEAVAYLSRTLALVKRFKEELAFVPAHTASNSYPPVSVIYGKSTPTVYGAKVDGRDAIKHADAFDELAFASGDGVVLAKASMVPEGYTTARGGVISSERGHITLLGDLEAVGRCLNAVAGARRRGVGCDCLSHCPSARNEQLQSQPSMTGRPMATPLLPDGDLHSDSDDDVELRHGDSDGESDSDTSPGRRLLGYHWPLNASSSWRVQGSGSFSVHKRFPNAIED